MLGKDFVGRGAATAKTALRKIEGQKSKVRRDEVEWFVKMVEERKRNNDHTKEKKSW